MKIPTSKLFRDAYGKNGVAAFNVFNAEQVLAVFKGAYQSKCSVIVQLTPAACKYLDMYMLVQNILAVATLFPEVDFSLHLDHGDLEYCKKAISTGYFDSVMIDASHLKFEENVKLTKQIVGLAAEKEISVEAELGVLSGVEDDVSVAEKNARYTDPEQAREFVELTGCNSLAVAVGTSHGAYKFSGNQGLQISILQEIQGLLPGFPLVLHGASAVPIEEIERINAAGGKLEPNARGIAGSDIHAAIKSGVCKINIATDMRLIWTRVHREFFKNHPEKFDMVIPGTEYIDVLQHFVTKKCLDLKVNNN